MENAHTPSVADWQGEKHLLPSIPASGRRRPFAKKTEGKPMNDPQPKWVCLDSDDSELLRAWEQLSDPVAMHPLTGEVWQYHGTTYDDQNGWRHGFRHRQDPQTGYRQVRWIWAKPGWCPKADTDSERI